jgi:hypothetical protein
MCSDLYERRFDLISKYDNECLMIVKKKSIYVQYICKRKNSSKHFIQLNTVKSSTRYHIGRSFDV